MHLRPGRLALRRFLIIIGTLVVVFNEALAQDRRGPLEIENPPLVEVEPVNIMPADVTGGYLLVPYRLRREKWGTTVGVAFSTFVPLEYDPDFYAGDPYEEVYGDDYAAFELHVNFKRNFSFGSIGIEGAAGTYTATGQGPYQSKLTLYPLRAGVQLALDNLFYEPYVVPYGSAGVYTIFFSEEQAAVTFSGNTTAAPYFGGGLMFQLNWLDPLAARESYQEAGIENTFLYAEALYFGTSQEARDKDFSSLHYNAGIKIEF